MGESCETNCPREQPNNKWIRDSVALTDLEEVEIVGFKAKDHEIDFLKLLFQCATMLRRVTLKVTGKILLSSDGYNKTYNIHKEYPHVVFYVVGIPIVVGAEGVVVTGAALAGSMGPHTQLHYEVFTLLKQSLHDRFDSLDAQTSQLISQVHALRGRGTELSAEVQATLVDAHAILMDAREQFTEALETMCHSFPRIGSQLVNICLVADALDRLLDVLAAGECILDCVVAYCGCSCWDAGGGAG